MLSVEGDTITGVGEGEGGGMRVGELLVGVDAKGGATGDRRSALLVLPRVGFSLFGLD